MVLREGIYCVKRNDRIGEKIEHFGVVGVNKEETYVFDLWKAGDSYFLGDRVRDRVVNIYKDSSDLSFRDLIVEGFLEKSEVEDIKFRYMGMSEKAVSAFRRKYRSHCQFHQEA
jgi:hypothetical protein